MKRRQQKVFIKNKPATFEYAIEERLTAGIVLTGPEIKSVRESKVSFNDAHCLFHQGELWLKSLYIGAYASGGYVPHEPTRDRKLLLTKKELKKWSLKVREKGYAIIPLNVHLTEEGWAKVEVGLGRGKKQHDKRASIKERDAKRDIQRGE